MNGFLRFCAGVGILILAGMGAVIVVTALGIAALAVLGINPFPVEH